MLTKVLFIDRFFSHARSCSTVHSFDWIQNRNSLLCNQELFVNALIGCQSNAVVVIAGLLIFSALVTSGGGGGRWTGEEGIRRRWLSEAASWTLKQLASFDSKSVETFKSSAVLTRSPFFWRMPDAILCGCPDSAGPNWIWLLNGLMKTEPTVSNLNQKSRSPLQCLWQ